WIVVTPTSWRSGPTAQENPQAELAGLSREYDQRAELLLKSAADRVTTSALSRAPFSSWARLSTPSVLLRSTDTARRRQRRRPSVTTLGHTGLTPVASV